MRHLSNVSHPAPRRASLKGDDDLVKDCTPFKENLGKCEDNPEETL